MMPFNFTRFTKRDEKQVGQTPVFLNIFSKPKSSCYKYLAILLLLTALESKAQLLFSQKEALLLGMEYTGGQTATVQTADINRDGYTDILYTLGAGGPIVYFQNDGGVSFSIPNENPFAAFTLSSPAGFVLNTSSSIADFDADGDLDIWGRIAGNDNDIFLINNNGTYQEGAGGLYSSMEFTGIQTATVQVVDINRDGLVDILYNVGTAGPIVYLQNNNGISFSTPQENPFAAFAAGTPPGFTLNATSSIADFDADGDLEIWVRIAGTGILNDVYLSSVDGLYQVADLPENMEFTTSNTGTAQVADMNGDGYADILYTRGIGGSLVYLQNNAGKSFNAPVENPFDAFAVSTPAGFVLNTSSSIADFDGDGDLDIWQRIAGTGADYLITAAGTAPVLVSSMPAHHATEVQVDANIVLEFNENIFTGAGNIQLVNAANNEVLESILASGGQVSGSGTATLVINPAADLATGSSYYVTLDRGALVDADGIIVGSLDLAGRVRVPAKGPNFLLFSTASGLPVRMAYFNAVLTEGKTMLRWETTWEDNSRDFVVQHSLDARNWKTIGTVSAARTSQTANTYEFIHQDVPQGKSYYRLKQEDWDDNYMFTQIRVVQNNISLKLLVFPNPVTERITVTIPGHEKAIVKLYNAAGVQIWSETYQQPTVTFSVSNLTAGIYKVVVLQNGKHTTKTFIRQ